MIRRATVLFALLATAGTALAQPPRLAPTGTLRAAFLRDNPVQARVDARTGETTGPIVDLVKELAARLRVPYELVPAANAAAVIGHVNNGTADIGFLAYEAARARDVDFAGGFATMFNSYVVAAASPLKTVADADRPGVRVGAVKGQTQEIFLSRTLTQARMRVFDATPSGGEIERLLVSGELDAFALNQQRALEAATQSNGRVRALAGSYVDVDQSFVVKKGDAASVRYLDAFVEELKASGFVKASLDRARLTGVGVAPSRKR